MSETPEKNGYAFLSLDATDLSRKSFKVLPI